MPRPLAALTLTVAVLLALAPPAHAAWLWPLHGELITSYRNGDDPYAAGQHRGIDIAGGVGAPVVAAAGGEVRFAGVAGSSGLTVSIRTADGFDTSYLHLSSAAVRAGATVRAGDAIGAVGTSGSRSAADPHLHFGVREAGTQPRLPQPARLPPCAAPGGGARARPGPRPGAPASAARPVAPPRTRRASRARAPARARTASRTRAAWPSGVRAPFPRRARSLRRRP